MVKQGQPNTNNRLDRSGGQVLNVRSAAAAFFDDNAVKRFLTSQDEL